MHAATSKVENSAQGLSCKLKFVHAQPLLGHRRSGKMEMRMLKCQRCRKCLNGENVERLKHIKAETLKGQNIERLEMLKG